MSSTPAARPPAGWVVQFDNPETSHRNTGLIMTSIGLVCMSAIMLLRLYTKSILFRLFAIDDGELSRNITRVLYTKDNVQSSPYYHLCVKSSPYRFTSAETCLDDFRHLARLLHLWVSSAHETEPLLIVSDLWASKLLGVSEAMHANKSTMITYVEPGTTDSYLESHGARIQQVQQPAIGIECDIHSHGFTCENSIVALVPQALARSL